MSSSMASSQSVRDGPFSLITTPKYKTGMTDKYTEVATVMAVVHNCIIRGFNGIYNQALEVKPDDYHDFISYTNALCIGIDSHHAGEESHVFPVIEASTGVKGLMATNVAQHEAFHAGSAALSSYLASFLTSTQPLSAFSGAHLRSLIDAFAAPLNQHLHDEIDSLPALSTYGDALDIMAIMEAEAKSAMGGLSSTAVLPAFLLNHDAAFENGLHAGFPPAPAPVKWVLFHVCTWWHAGWWRFASCDTYGRLKKARTQKHWLFY